MPSAALARLESILSARKLDHTLASHRFHETDAGSRPLSPPWGCPRGQISEIVGARSSGRQTLLVSWLAAATGCGELTALVDPLDMFDPASAAAHDVSLTRLLWVRDRALTADAISLPREIGDLRGQIERAIKALNLILQAGGFGLVALDLGEVPMRVVSSLPFTTWRRLHRVIEGGETACVVVASEPVARSVGGITVELDHPLNAEGTESTERFIFKNAASTAASAHSELKSGHVRLLPDLTIKGTAVHARGMRTDRFELSSKWRVSRNEFNPQPVTRN